MSAAYPFVSRAIGAQGATLVSEFSTIFWFRRGQKPPKDANWPVSTEVPGLGIALIDCIPDTATDKQTDYVPS